jgi:N-methylhydantoinase A
MATNGNASGRFIVGVDIGGTFTDAVAIDPISGEARVGKALTRPGQEEDGALDAIADMGVPMADIAEIVHGHTTGLNAVLSRGGAKVGLLASQGYRDLLDIGRMDRPYEEQFNLRWKRPHQERPLVPRRLRREVPGRLDAEGDERVPLDTEEVRRIVLELSAAGATSFAICLMNSYLDQVHEDAVERIVRELAPDAYVQTSRVYPLAKETERTTTVVLDAYTGPLVIDYLNRLDSRLADSGLAGPVWIMGMNGGVGSLEQSKRFPVTHLLSGPVGGVAHAVAASPALGGDLVTLDMGGTSTDVAVIHGGDPTHTDHWPVEWGLSLYLPMIEINTIGAGAGSIIAVDDVGSLSVGPRSAGSVPGPACYGRGATEPALTDAFVVLGMIQPEFFFGGRMRLDAGASERVIAPVARAAGITAHELADAAYRLSVSHIAEAIRAISTYRGLDVRTHALVAGGAAGPLVAADVAHALGFRAAIIPRDPGQFSAFGLAVADVRVTESAAVMGLLGAYTPDGLNAAFRALEEGATRQITDQGLSADNVRVIRSYKGMYVGQTWDNSYPASPGPYDEDALAEIERSFHDLYEQRSGSSSAEIPIMVTALEVTAVVPRGAPNQYTADAQAVSGDGAPKKVAPVWWRNARLDTPFIQRLDLPVGQAVAGPAVVLEPHATTVVPPGVSVTAHREGHLTLVSTDETERR